MEPSELQQWRARAGLNLVQLAQQLGIRHTTVMRWERGQRAIPPFLPLALQAIDDGHTIAPPNPEPVHSD